MLIKKSNPVKQLIKISDLLVKCKYCGKPTIGQENETEPICDECVLKNARVKNR